MKNDRRYSGAGVAFYAALFAASSPGAVGAKEAPAPNRIMLFDGDTLNGWNLAIHGQGLVDVAEQDIVKVTQDGTLHVYAGKAHGSEQPMGLLFTRNDYSHYKVHVEYKWGAAKFPPRMDLVRDAGLLFHIAGPMTYDGRPEWVWPVAAECQIQETDTGDLWLIGTRAATFLHTQDMVYSDEGAKRYRGYPGGSGYDSSKHAFENEVEGWNTIELIVNGDAAEFFVNGEKLNAISELQKWDDESGGWAGLDSGAIGLQAESAEVFYRNIWLEPLGDAHID
jgi:hypothetical protein